MRIVLYVSRSLAQKKIASEADALAVIAALHARGVSTVILSSLDFDPLARPQTIDGGGKPGGCDYLVGYISALTQSAVTVRF